MEYQVRYKVIKPIQQQPGVQNALLIGQPQVPTTAMLVPSTNSNVGIAFVVIYIFTFLYLYLSATFRGKLDLYHFTLSEAFEFSERIVPTILIPIFICLMVLLYIEKGIISSNSDSTKQILVGVSFGLLTMFMLLFLVPPDFRSRHSMNLHAIVAILLLTTVIYTSYVISYLYYDIYGDQGLIDDLINCMYTMITFTLAVALSFMIIYIFNNDFVKKYMNVTIGISEIILLITFGTIIGILSFLPPLVNVEKNCTITAKS